MPKPLHQPNPVEYSVPNPLLHPNLVDYSVHKVVHRPNLLDYSVLKVVHRPNLVDYLEHNLKQDQSHSSDNQLQLKVFLGVGRDQVCFVDHLQINNNKMLFIFKVKVKLVNSRVSEFQIKISYRLKISILV